MYIIFFMIGISLLMALTFLGAFLWSMKTGQHDDLYTPSIRILLDDAEPTTSTNTPDK
ncbi:cytochrome oxidase maturation protein, cbb3-type [Fibrisoma limi BUZ 3]|uniref:Cytochrome oxidase maturation protein, cbb3-type n=1 Tax=Fibrisoma limi BUZ 3 TaxID=1185876 RepID=I2GIT2_9BACT|nr:cbb3-type cytochrome oxidase assembly protein CcoS [Fibrisoma limi]CCH53807.1 cytochrome oxidase maturation protein, cbb3-type [Fibrisoma limi BUZ 3]